MRYLILLFFCIVFSSCSEVEDNQRYLVQARLTDFSNQPISDIRIQTIRGSNFFSPSVLLGSGLTDLAGEAEFVSLVPTGSRLNLRVNPILINESFEADNEYSSVNLKVDKDLISTDKTINLGTLQLFKQHPFSFKIRKTSTTPAVLDWQLIYQTSSSCTFDILDAEDFNQNFSCQRTAEINRINDTNNPNDNLNLRVNENTILTFIYTINNQENQVIEISLNTNENEFEFNY